jgi:hypothetical protein
MITWEALVRRKPQLNTILYMAAALTAKEGFCANSALGIFERAMNSYVGWYVDIHCSCYHNTTAARWVELDEGGEHDPDCDKAEPDAWLKTSAAWDVVLDKIYSALPDCKHYPGGCDRRISDDMLAAYPRSKRAGQLFSHLRRSNASSI